MSRFNPLHVVTQFIAYSVAVRARSVRIATPRARRFRRIVATAMLLAAVPAAAQEVIVRINPNSCWNVCGLAASQTYNDWIDNGRSEAEAMTAAEGHFNTCMYYCEGPF